MQNLDLRQVGKIIGLPIYVDVSDVPNVQVKSDPMLTERDRKAMMASTIMQRSFRVGEKPPASVRPDPEELLPIIATAIMRGEYEFIGKNSIRIYSLDPLKYEGELAQITRSIEVRWT
jgi:hypothetical protein